MTERSDTPTEQDIEDAAHNAPRMAAFGFIRAVWVDNDLRAAWPLTDPLLRRCWAQAWLTEERGLGGTRRLDATVEAFTADRPVHRLWKAFARAQMPLLDAMEPRDLNMWGLSALPEVIAPDVELLRMRVIPAGVDEAVVAGSYIPLLMRYEQGPGWRLLNLVSENIPVPGWPPTL